jgi:hypothetical protein
MSEKNSNVLEGYECPKCKSQGPFRVGITVHGVAYVCDDGWEELRSEETEFHLGRPARCLDCCHEGLFSAFAAAGATRDGLLTGDALLLAYERVSGNTVHVSDAILDGCGRYIGEYSDDMAREYLGHNQDEGRCPHAMFYSGAGACPQCGRGAE